MSALWIWILFVAVTGLVALTGFTSHRDAVSPAESLEVVANNDAESSNTTTPAPETHAVAKCSQCGFVASMRELSNEEADLSKYRIGSSPGKLARQHEVTVQMSDGSHHVFTESGPSIWRIGERMIVVGDLLRTDA